MSISDKIKAINNKIEQNKVQYDLDRQLLRFLLYHQEMLVNFDRQIFFTKKDCLKSCLWAKNWKQKQTDIAKKQNQKLDNTYEFYKIIKKEKVTFKKK